MVKKEIMKIRSELEEMAEEARLHQYTHLTEQEIADIRAKVAAMSKEELSKLIQRMRVETEILFLCSPPLTQPVRKRNGGAKKNGNSIQESDDDTW